MARELLAEDRHGDHVQLAAARGGRPRRASGSPARRADDRSSRRRWCASTALRQTVYRHAAVAQSLKPTCCPAGARLRGSVPLEERLTYCRICEANCGMVATVDGDEVVQLRPDRDHPLSAGYACPKGIAFPEVQHDPDRVTHPLRRKGDCVRARLVGGGPRRHRRAPEGAAARLDRVVPRQPRGLVVRARGVGEGVLRRARDASTSTAPARRTSTTASPRARCCTGRRCWSRSPTSRAPTCCSSSAPTRSCRTGRCSASRACATACTTIVARGGRVVVVDPRRTETARHFEHVPILPDGDAWLLLSLLQVIFSEGLETAAAVRRPRDAARARRAVRPRGDRRPHRPRSRGRSARSPATWRRRRRAAIYGRTGLVPRDARDAGLVPARRARRRHRQPRPAGRLAVRRPRDRPRQDDVAVRPGVVRHAALARRRVPGRARADAGDAHGAGDRRRPATGSCAR